MTTVADRRPIKREFRPDCPVGELRPHPKNARDHDRESIREGLLGNPQYKPVVAQRSTGNILVGNGTFSVATEDLGWTHIDVHYVDVDDAAALKILAADNYIGSKSKYHSAALAALLGEIADSTAGGLDGTGYTFDDLDDLVAGLAEAGDKALADLPIPGPPPVLHAAPATDAAYAETPEEEAARAERLATQVPRSSQGLTEWVLVYGQDGKAEALRLMNAAREVLGEDTRAPDVVLRALRVLVSVLDCRNEPDPLPIVPLLMEAGYTKPDDAPENEGDGAPEDEGDGAPEDEGDGEGGSS